MNLIEVKNVYKQYKNGVTALSDITLSIPKGDFVFVIGFSCFLMHPVGLAISTLCAFIYSVMLKGKRSIKTNLAYMLPTMLFAALINAAFNHEGITIIGYFPGGNPLTLESLIYGLCAAIMIVSVIFWFSCYNEIMTSDKFIYLFGFVYLTTFC